MLRITVDNEVYGEYPLDQDQTIAINDTNICEIRDGKAKMIKADCPDHLCIKTAAVTKKRRDDRMPAEPGISGGRTSGGFGCSSGCSRILMEKGYEE